MSTLSEALIAITTHPPQRREGDRDALTRMIAVLLEEAGVSDVAGAIDAIHDASLTGARAIADASTIDFLNVLRSSAPRIPPRVAATIKHLGQWVADFEDGQAERLDEPGRSTQSLRDGLASIKGVGRRTADALVLHALARPAFPLDRGTYRILVRHGWLDVTADYDEAHDLVVHAAGGSPDALAAAEQTFTDVARRHCRVQAPRCAGCPLEPFLPEGGALEIDG